MNHRDLKTDVYENEISSGLWPIDIQRYNKIKVLLKEWSYLFSDKNVMDFGAGYGLSISALLFNGAKYVIGIDPDEERVNIGKTIIKNAGLDNSARLIHVKKTEFLPFKSEQFNFVIANGVLEHIQGPRNKYLREMWRVLSTRGHLMISETPNKYFPKEIHTTNLWFNHWLAEYFAYKRAIKLKRFAQERKDWNGSGWRGLGYFEVISAIKKPQLVPERSRLRHRIFHAFGIPASIIDPYPIWIFRKA